MWGTLIQAHQVSLHTREPQHLPPRQLPAPRPFFDRAEPHAYLDRAWNTRHGPLWAAVEGSSGIGKTAFVTDWAHRRPDRWPDGWVYADLTHSDADTILRGWLTALGCTSLPEHPEVLYAMWRTFTTHRRLLAVLDNTAQETAESILPLLPTGVGCAGVVIGQRGLAGLIAHGARLVRLAPLAPEIVRALISYLVDYPLPAPVLDAAVDNTSGSPLIAALSAVQLSQNSRLTPDQFAPRSEKDSTVNDHVTQILNNLPKVTARAASLLAVHPGPHLTAELAGSLLETTLLRAQSTLADLVEAELLTDLGQDRYASHHLVLPALVDRLTSTDRASAVDQLCSHYRLRTAAMDLAINPWRWRVDEEAIAQVREPDAVWFATANDALAWGDRELPNVLAVARMVSNLGGRPFLWQISDHLGTYVVKRKPMAAARELYRLGLEQARAERNLPALGLMFQRVGAVAPDRATAREHAEHALKAYRQAGHQQGVASALETLGGAYRASGDLKAAAKAFIESERIHTNLGRQRGAALQRRKLSEIRADQGRLEEALAGFVDSHRVLLELERPDVYQATRSVQGAIDVAKEIGQPVITSLLELLCNQGLHSARVVGSIHQQASLYTALADIAHGRGDRSGEHAALTEAHQLLEPTGHPDTVLIAERLLETVCR